MFTYHAEKGWFNYAGTKYYGWEEDGHDIKGIGLRRELLRDREQIHVEVDGITYLLNCQEAIDFVIKYKSYYQTRHGTQAVTLGIISKSLLTKVEKKTCKSN